MLCRLQKGSLGGKNGLGLHRQSQSQSPQSFRSYLISFILGLHLLHILLIIASNDQSRGDYTKPLTRASLQCPLLALRQYLNRHNSTWATFLDQWQAQGESPHTISKKLGFVHLLWRSVPFPPDQNPKQTATRVAQNRDNSELRTLKWLLFPLNSLHFENSPPLALQLTAHRPL
jgi:hypothetical protein